MYKTSDLSIAAYLMMKGMKLIAARRERNGRFHFVFDDPADVGNKYAIEYVNSESAKFDSHIKNLKNIIFKK